MELIKADMVTFIIALASASAVAAGVYELLKEWFHRWRKSRRELKAQKGTPKRATIVIKGKDGQELEIPLDPKNEESITNAIEKLKIIHEAEVAQGGDK